MTEETNFNIEEFPKTPEELAAEKKDKAKKEIIDWVKTLFFYCVLPLTVFQIFCFMASVPTGSMNPTIPIGSQVLTVRTFDKDDVERGDIVVFESRELDVVLIKRCIGLPGDKLVFDGTGDLYINGELYPEPYVSSYSSFKGEFTVPEDHYFFCGDNRGGSYDCREFTRHYIHKDDIMGKGKFVIFPFSSFGTLE